MFRQQLKNRGIRIELDLKYDLPLIRADMLQLEQVFINLINNARDSFEEKKEDKKIMISSQLNNNQIQIIFRDNGKGIAPENTNKIFDAFYTTKEKGTGLGLYISQYIIRSYGGKIAARNTRDEGTSFVINLPIPNQEE
jgi:C4-dicarboxylate-specific signal transduction histidine kinase